MAVIDKESRADHRRSGFGEHLVAIAVNAILLVVARNLVAWDLVPFLTDDFDRVVPAITLSLGVTIAVHVLRLIHDGRSFAILTDAVAMAFGAYAMVRLFQVFPFDLDSQSPWSLVIRAVLIVGIAGSVIAVLVAPLRLLSREEGSDSGGAARG